MSTRPGLTMTPTPLPPVDPHLAALTLANYFLTQENHQLRATLHGLRSQINAFLDSQQATIDRLHG